MMLRRVMQTSFGTIRSRWYSVCAMGQARFLSNVHKRVQESARAGAILDAYRLADELMAQDISYGITRAEAVRTILAAGVVYGASMLLDPEDDSRPAANEDRLADDAPLLLSA